MANNQYVNKVVYNGTTLIDLTSDTATAADVLATKTFHDKSGTEVTGSITSKSAATYTPTTSNQTIAAGQYLSGAQTIAGDANLVAANIKDGTTVFGITGTFTGDGTATASEILATKTAYVDGAKVTGTMANNGAVSGSISTKAGQYTVPQGYHDGSGKVSIAAAEQAKIIEGNIKSGVQILGVTGTYSGESITAQTKTVTPTAAGFAVTPDAGYDYLAQVNVSSIPYTETDNLAGGKTVTIATAA